MYGYFFFTYIYFMSFSIFYRDILLPGHNGEHMKSKCFLSTIYQFTIKFKRAANPDATASAFVFWYTLLALLIIS